ncbi:MAG: hypothetical protein AAF411_11355 [Myxococcota bacterium]
MAHIDEFESMFRSASRSPFRLAAPEVAKVLAVGDLEQADGYVAAVREFAEPMLAGAQLVLAPHDVLGVEAMLRLVEDEAPDLIVTYRNLHSDGWRYKYSLGADLNALTRGTQVPVLVTPSPRAYPSMEWRSTLSDHVMVLDESLAGDDSREDDGLLNWAALATREGGTLHLVHMEDDRVLERYLRAIGKIAALNTDAARETLPAQLLKEPRHYMKSVQAAFKEAGRSVTIREHVQLGHRVADYRVLIERGAIDLVVMRALEEDRIALGGASYSLAVALVETPLLMV